MKESLFRILNKFRHGVEVIEAGPDHLEDCIALAFDACVSAGLAPEGDMERRGLIERLGDRLTKIIYSTEGCVLLAKRDGEAAGIVYCGLTPAEPWQDKPTMALWDIYVVPGSRNDGQVALGLMRAGIGRAITWGVGVMCISLDDKQRKEIERYTKIGGFEFVTTQSVYSLRVGGN
jgi:hypothetical protein